MATHSSILAWRIPWTEEPGGLESDRTEQLPLPLCHFHLNIYAIFFLERIQGLGAILFNAARRFRCLWHQFSIWHITCLLFSTSGPILCCLPEDVFLGKVWCVFNRFQQTSNPGPFFVSADNEWFPDSGRRGVGSGGILPTGPIPRRTRPSPQRFRRRLVWGLAAQPPEKSR